MTQLDERNEELQKEFDEVYASPALKRWRALKEVAPDLARFENRGWNNGAPPSELSKSLYVALCACFAEPTKREILRALILDLLADDLQEILKAFLTEDSQ